jgi:hypothetical protein
VHSPLGQPEVRLTLTITNADELYWCPKVVWEWPDGTRSAQEGDCVPYEEATRVDLDRRTVYADLPMQLPPGIWTVKALLVRADTVFHREEIIINVSGRR